MVLLSECFRGLHQYPDGNLIITTTEFVKYIYDLNSAELSEFSGKADFKILSMTVRVSQVL